eukprot:4177956-Pyramimonas_sp.AAC.1
MLKRVLTNLPVNPTKRITKTTYSAKRLNNSPHPSNGDNCLEYAESSPTKRPGARVPMSGSRKIIMVRICMHMRVPRDTCGNQADTKAYFVDLDEHSVDVTHLPCRARRAGTLARFLLASYSLLTRFLLDSYALLMRFLRALDSLASYSLASYSPLTHFLLASYSRFLLASYSLLTRFLRASYSLLTRSLLASYSLTRRAEVRRRLCDDVTRVPCAFGAWVLINVAQMRPPQVYPLVPAPIGPRP